MSNPKSPTAAAVPTESAEVVAERERLLPELEKQARTASGATQALLRKLHELVMHTRPGAPVDFQIYKDVKAALDRFMKDPVIPPPPVIMQTLGFLQSRQVALGYTGKMQLPPGAPPPPPGLVAPLAASAPAPAPAASTAPSVKAKDGFEGSARPPGSVALQPADGSQVSQGKEAEFSATRLPSNLKG